MRQRSFLAVSATFALMAGLAIPAHAIFSLEFDEYGNGTRQDATNPGFGVNNPGYLALDPTGGVAGLVLIYDLPNFVNDGDVGFIENATSGALSDVLRFYRDANTSHMIFYSDIDGDGAPADSGLPTQFSGNFFTLPEVNGLCILNYAFPNDNQYIGHSDGRVFTPEPITMSLGIAGIGLFMRRRANSKKG